jgi:predicted O-methyltransferase YrrM
MCTTNVSELAEELAHRWSRLFKERDWHQRLVLLTEIHEKLQEDLANLDALAELSPLFIERLVDTLNEAEVICFEHAHISANSAKESHRQLAYRFFLAHDSK